MSEVGFLLAVGTMTAKLEDDNGCMTLFSLPDGGMSVSLVTTSGKECCRLSISRDYSKAMMWIGGSLGERCYSLDTALMMLYAFAAAPHDTILVHASAVEYEGRGYLFLGKSGTGKSTHSRMWIENVEGTKLLNDDNPVVRITDDRVYVYGSPWSGKTPCYLNRSVQTGGVIRLHQASYNRITQLTGVKAYAALLPSCSFMKWNRDMSESVHRTVSRVTALVRLYNIECMPDRDAAILCMKTAVSNR